MPRHFRLKHLDAGALGKILAVAARSERYTGFVTKKQRTDRERHCAETTEAPVVVEVQGVGRCIPIDRLIERDPRALQLLDELIESSWT